MNWKYWLSAGEPRPRYALLVAIGVVVMMALTYSIWHPGRPGLAAFAAVAVNISSHVSDKMIVRQ